MAKYFAPGPIPTSTEQAGLAVCSAAAAGGVALFALASGTALLLGALLAGAGAAGAYMCARAILRIRRGNRDRELKYEVASGVDTPEGGTMADWLKQSVVEIIKASPVGKDGVENPLCVVGLPYADQTALVTRYGADHFRRFTRYDVIILRVTPWNVAAYRYSLDMGTGGFQETARHKYRREQFPVPDIDWLTESPKGWIVDRWRRPVHITRWCRWQISVPGRELGVAVDLESDDWNWQEDGMTTLREHGERVSRRIDDLLS
ncbi:hypothetical protein [Streptomyces sp. NPDC047043]|uniref:hypothetical protein n=1 Tax=Streptomyces sp. NPDC047043 TaxID=3154497 RepID=UPI0033F3511D